MVGHGNSGSHGFRLVVDGFEDKDQHSGGRGDVARVHRFDGGGAGPGVDIDTVEGRCEAGGVDTAHADARLRLMESEDVKTWTRSSDVHAGDVLGGGEVTIGH